MDQPSKSVLLEAVRGFLQGLSAELEGVARFHARVAANALAIVLRELELERPVLEAHRVRLGELLGCPGHDAPPLETEALRESVEAMERDLVVRIRAGDADAGPWRDRLLCHLRDSVRERLSISSPDYR